MCFEDSLLFKKLEELDEDYIKLVNNVYDKFKDHLEAIKDLFPEYTEHGVEHSKSVLKALEENS